MSNNLSIVQYMGQDKVLDNIKQTLGDKSNQFIASVASLVNSDKSIANCDKKSILSSCLIAASLDLPINQSLGFAFIISYKTKTGYKAQFQMGYKGFIQLALRSDKFKTINVTDVKEGELIESDLLTGEHSFKFLPIEDRKSVKTIGYVAYFELINGFKKQLYMTIDDLKKHGLRFSQSMQKGKGLWKDDFDVMAAKTVIKLLLSKYGPMTSQMAKARDADGAVIEDNEVMYIDNKPLDPVAESKEVEIDRIKKYIKNSKTVDDLLKCSEAVEDYSSGELNDLFDKKLNELEVNES